MLLENHGPINFYNEAHMVFGLVSVQNERNHLCNKISNQSMEDHGPFKLSGI